MNAWLLDLPFVADSDSSPIVGVEVAIMDDGAGDPDWLLPSTCNVRF
jgi:hypothetical protein